jgi:hypothetical protein
LNNDINGYQWKVGSVYSILEEEYNGYDWTYEHGYELDTIMDVWGFG